jgi:hypothetical protein
VADWATVSALATAGGTLVLAAATFASVRSANRAARAAERSLLAGLRPVLMPTRMEDPQQKVGFVDQKWLVLPGGQGAAEATDEAVYLAIAVRNAGSGIAVLHGWTLTVGRPSANGGHAPIEDFHRLTRDLYIAGGDSGFWQGAFRDVGTDEFVRAKRAVEAREPLTVDVLYGDHEGGQRVVSRFSLLPRDDGGWIAGVARHWNIDRPDPR